MEKEEEKGKEKEIEGEAAEEKKERPEFDLLVEEKADRLMDVALEIYQRTSCSREANRVEADKFMEKSSVSFPMAAAMAMNMFHKRISKEAPNVYLLGESSTRALLEHVRGIVSIGFPSWSVQMLPESMVVILAYSFAMRIRDKGSDGLYTVRYEDERSVQMSQDQLDDKLINGLILYPPSLEGFRKVDARLHSIYIPIREMWIILGKGSPKWIAHLAQREKVSLPLFQDYVNAGCSIAEVRSSVHNTGQNASRLLPIYPQPITGDTPVDDIPTVGHAEPTPIALPSSIPPTVPIPVFPEEDIGLCSSPGYGAELDNDYVEEPTLDDAASEDGMEGVEDTSQQ